MVVPRRNERCTTIKYIHIFIYVYIYTHTCIHISGGSRLRVYGVVESLAISRGPFVMATSQKLDPNCLPHASAPKSGCPPGPAIRHENQAKKGSGYGFMGLGI